MGSSIPSPWQPGVLASSTTATPTVGTRPSRKARGCKPKAFKKQPSHIRNELCFAMKPLPCIVSLRKKVRNLKRKRRQPYSSFLVNTLMMRIEAQAVKTRPPKRPIDFDRIKKASRLESTVTKLSANAKKTSINGNSVQIQIQAWKPSGGSKSTAPPAPPPARPSSHHMSTSMGVTKVKSELCPVTETCTAATLPPATPSSAGSGNNKIRVKAEKTVTLNSALSSAGLLPSTPTSGKSQPIIPTIARIKNEGRGHVPSHPELSTTLISPDMQRIKVEFGHAPSNYRTSPADMPRLPTSPLPHGIDVRDGHFISPRKRASLLDFENGSPSLKRHRLSTDSRGSSSEGGGAGSPASSLAGGVAPSSPPRHNNGGGRVSSFSIDSIMSGGSTSSSSGGPTLHRPVPIPATPPRVNDLRSEGRAPSKSPARNTSPISAPQALPHTPLVVPITPYQSRNTPATPTIDPRLAHLAGVAANPSLGLHPTFSPAVAEAVMRQYYSPFVAPGIASLASLWGGALTPSTATPTTPLSTTSTTTSHLVNAPSSGRTSLSRQSSGGNATPPPSATTPNRPFSPWTTNQYRGEPKVATPSSKSSEIPKHVTIGSESGGM